MDTYDSTLELLLNLVAQAQDRSEAAHPPAPEEDYHARLQAFLRARQDDPALRREVLRLSDLHDTLEDRHAAFHFQAGVQLGLALGRIAVLSGSEGNSQVAVL